MSPLYTVSMIWLLYLQSTPDCQMFGDRCCQAPDLLPVAVGPDVLRSMSTGAAEHLTVGCQLSDSFWSVLTGALEHPTTCS